jgi:ABC-type transport system substrate-binding protein
MNNKKLLTIIASVFLLSALIPAYALNSSGGAGGSIAGPLQGSYVYKIITDSDAAFDAMLTNQLDAMTLERPDQITSATDAGFTLTHEAQQAVMALFYNFNHSIMNDLRFRQAIAHLLPKETLISTLYGPLQTYAVSWLGPAFGKYSNTSIEDYTYYDPEEAAYLLNAAGYTLFPNNTRKDPATGKTMRTLDLVYISDLDPNFLAMAQRYHDELEAVGIPVNMVAAPFNTGEWLGKCVFDDDYDITQMAMGSPAFTMLDAFWNSANIYPHGGVLDFARYNNTEFNALMAICSNSLNETAVINAMLRAQEILANDVAVLTFSYPVAWTAYRPEWTGMIEAPYSSYTETLRIRRKDGDYSKPFRMRINQDASSLVVGYDVKAVADAYTFLVCHTTIYDSNPYNGPYVPWVVKSWKLESWTDLGQNVKNGTKETITIQTGIKWHDGFDFTADDVAFAALYMKKKGVYRGILLGTTTKLVNAVATSPTTAVLYYNRSSLFILDGLYYLAAFPKHVFNDNVTLYGTPAGLGPGNYSGQVGYGVQDPSTFNGYTVTNPWNSSLTCFVGTGPYIYLPGGWQPGVSFTVVANRAYFKSILVTDINFDFAVDIIDIATGGKAFGSTPASPRWSVTVDVNGDKKIDIIDIAIIAKDFGKTW